MHVIIKVSLQHEYIPWHLKCSGTQPLRTRMQRTAAQCIRIITKYSPCVPEIQRNGALVQSLERVVSTPRMPWISPRRGCPAHPKSIRSLVFYWRAIPFSCLTWVSGVGTTPLEWKLLVGRENNPQAPPNPTPCPPPPHGVGCGGWGLDLRIWLRTGY